MARKTQRTELPVSQPPLDVPKLLKRYGIKPDRRLGQNFLINAADLERVVQAGEIQPHETVLEIGAGVGNLTRLLACQARRVLAVELDDDLIPILQAVTKDLSNVHILQGDILQIDLSAQLDSQSERYLVVANIPYYITSRLIRHLLEAPLPPQRLILTIQHEVAERICSSQGKLSLLALSVLVYGEPRYLARIPAVSFFPVPKVDSAILRIDLHAQPFIKREQLEVFFRLAKAGFSQKRKNLSNALRGGLKWDKQRTRALLQEAGLETHRRAESLNLEEWKRLVEVYLALSRR